MAGPSILSECDLERLVGKGLCSPSTVTALNALGYKKLTKIQLQVLPHLLSKENCYINARTGSGKTLAFLIPTIERLKAMKFKESHGVGALIISPTRELAQQTAKVVQSLAEAHGLSSITLIGGTKDKEKDLEKGAVIVLGTPGRLCKALKPSNSSRLAAQNLRVLILDEADKLLDAGANTELLRKIYSYLPKEKVQKILVSATVTSECVRLAKDVLEENDLKHISTETKLLPTTKHVKQNYLCVRTGDRLSMLITVLKTLRKKKVLVFFNSCHSVKFHNGMLSQCDLPVLHCVGQEKQNHRSSTYSKFKELKRGILLTTAMAERGWDIPGVHWIIVYDPPHKPEDYIHRIGRTGRGDSHVGQALLFLRPEEMKFIDVLHNMNVEISQLEFQGDLNDIQNQIVSIVDENRDVQEKAKIAYKKFVRAYQCHTFKNIFNIETLDLSEVSKSFGFSKPPMYLGHLK